MARGRGRGRARRERRVALPIAHARAQLERGDAEERTYRGAPDEAPRPAARGLAVLAVPEVRQGRHRAARALTERLRERVAELARAREARLGVLRERAFEHAVDVRIEPARLRDGRRLLVLDALGDGDGVVTRESALLAEGLVERGRERKLVAVRGKFAVRDAFGRAVRGRAE